MAIPQFSRISLIMILGRSFPAAMTPVSVTKAAREATKLLFSEIDADPQSRSRERGRSLQDMRPFAPIANPASLLLSVGRAYP